MDCLTSLKGDSVMADKEFLIQDPQNETQIGRGWGNKKKWFSENSCWMENGTDKEF